MGAFVVSLARRFPIDIGQCGSVRVRTARALAGVQALEPAMKRRIGITAIDVVGRQFVRRQDVTADTTRKDKCHKNDPISPICL
jgi:hypothetical protein